MLDLTGFSDKITVAEVAVSCFAFDRRLACCFFFSFFRDAVG